MHPLLEGALFAGALPAGLSAGLMAGSLALSKSGTACTWRGGIVVALPFLVSGLALGGGGGALDWLPYLALPAALHPRLLAWSARPHLSAAVRLLLALGGCALLAYNKLRFAWEWGQAAYTLGALALAWYVFAQAVQAIPAHTRGVGARGELPGLLGVSAAVGASAPIWGIAGSLSLAQASGALAAIGAVLAGFVWLRPAAQIPRATLPALVYLWGATVVAGCLLVYELSAWVPLGFALVPVLAAQLDRPRARRLPSPALRGLAGAACAAPVGGGVAILPAPEPEAAPDEANPYADYEGWTPSGE
ncbi:MAG: hypothetical protein KDD82_28880 [Planctomycetes bacterium]|nr:hypothetical protein [Planctomycetota bacterium]